MWAHPDRQAGLVPAIVSWNIEKAFPASFEWTGTRDPAAWLSIPAAFDFMDRLGEEKVRDYNHDLVLEGSRMLAVAWGVKINAPESMISSMALIPLPEIPSHSATLDERERIQRTLWETNKIACPCVLFEGRLHVRVSAQIYNSIGDFEKLSRAIDQLR